MGLLRGDEGRAVAREHQPRDRGGARVHVAGRDELAHRHRDRWLPAPAPPRQRRGVVDRAERTRDARRRGSEGALLHASLLGPRVPRYPRAPVTSEMPSPPVSIDDPDVIETTVREAAERN